MEWERKVGGMWAHFLLMIEYFLKVFGEGYSSLLRDVWLRHKMSGGGDCGQHWGATEDIWAGQGIMRSFACLLDPWFLSWRNEQSPCLLKEDGSGPCLTPWKDFAKQGRGGLGADRAILGSELGTLGAFQSPCAQLAERPRPYGTLLAPGRRCSLT